MLKTFHSYLNKETVRWLFVVISVHNNEQVCRLLICTLLRNGLCLVYDYFSYAAIMMHITYNVSEQPWLYKLVPPALLTHW